MTAKTVLQWLAAMGAGFGLVALQAIVDSVPAVVGSAIPDTIIAGLVATALTRLFAWLVSKINIPR